MNSLHTKVPKNTEKNGNQAVVGYACNLCLRRPSRTKVIVGYKVTLTSLSHRDPASKNKTKTIHANRQKGSKTDVM